MNSLIKKFPSLKKTNLDSRKFFIIGTGRSGTHWLGYILEEHPDIYVTIEKPKIFDIVKTIALDFRKKEQLLPELIECYKQEHNRIAQLNYADKSHPNIWWAEELAEIFPNSLFIGIQRNPYATVASMLKHSGVLSWHQRWKEFPVPNPFLGITQDNVVDYANLTLASQCALRWNAHLERMEELRSKLSSRLHVVSYENLILDTQEQIRQLEEFLQLKSPIPIPKVKSESLERWKYELSPQNIDDITKILGNYALNYYKPAEK